MKPLNRFLLPVALAFILVEGGDAVDLRKFAEEATGATPEAKKKKKEQRQAVRSSSNSSFGSGTFPSEDEGGASFLGGFYAWLIASPLGTHTTDPTASIDAEASDGTAVQQGIFPIHLPGEATVPYARFDYNWQSVDSETDADDLRVELGYKFLAFYARSTMYTTPSRGQDMDINQLYAVLRYGGYRADFLPGTFEAGLGVGGSWIKLDDALGSLDDSTVAFTLFAKYYPVQWFGVEFRPAWYSFDGSRIGDYDLSVSVGFRYLQLRGGYRWLGFNGSSEDLNGPYAGLSASF
jgi:hypothetical protein